MSGKVDTTIGDTKTDDPKMGTSAEGVKTDDIESQPENDDFLSDLFDSTDESHGDAIPNDKKCGTAKVGKSPDESLNGPESKK